MLLGTTGWMLPGLVALFVWMVASKKVIAAAATGKKGAGSFQLGTQLKKPMIANKIKAKKPAAKKPNMAKRKQSAKKITKKPALHKL